MLQACRRRLSFLLLSLSLLVSQSSCDPEVLNSILETAGGSTGITNAETAVALKDALEQGAVKGADLVSVVNGYYGNSLIRIPLPPEAKPIEDALKIIPGGKKLLNDAELSINRAAEEAAKKAAPIFIDAITSMTIIDALDILFGDKDAATRYLEKTTGQALSNEFTPIIDDALSSVGATALWGDVMETYNKIPLVKDVDPDLTSFVTTKALDGLFLMVEQEEEKIRDLPALRTTETMKKVFDYYDQNK